MNERQRMQYLEAMGIAYYVPRWQLPAAKFSELCELPAANAPSEALADEADQLAAPQSPASYPMVPKPEADATEEISRLDAIVSDLKQEKTLAPAVADPGSATSTEANNTAEQSESEEAAATFSLSLWRASPELQVIDSRRPGDALPTQALLVNILSAANLLKLNLPKAEHLNWPMVDTHADKSWAAAREMIQGFFEGRFAAQPVKIIVIFGEAAFKALSTDADNFADQCYSVKSLAAFDADAFILPSLSEILYSPQIKARVWASFLQIRQGVLAP